MRTRKKVCIIRSNPVTPDSRVEKEAYTLEKAGYDVCILAWDRNSNIKERSGIIGVADQKISIIWLGYKAGFGEGKKSLKSFILFQIHMMKWLLKHRKEYDIIHACDFDTAICSYIINIIIRKKYIFDIFDFAYADPKNIIQIIIKYLQIIVIDHADGTIVCTEQRIEQIKEANPNRLCVIHNSPFYEQMDTSSKKIIKSNSDNIKVVYVGVFLDERLLKPIGHFMSVNPEIEWHIAGFGVMEKYFEELSRKTKNIFYYGKISYDKALKLESECDIMLAIYDPSDENCRRAAPNKFYESLMLGKPVIMAKETGMSQIVANNNIGVLIDFSEAGFAKGIRELISLKSEWGEMGCRSKKIYYDQYSWKLMSTRLVKFYTSIIEE